MRRLLCFLLLLAAGCGERIARPYTEEELERRCVIQGGWWHRDLNGGFCEFQAPGMP